MSGPEWGSFMSGSESGSEGFYSEPKSVGEAKVEASFWGGPENGREEGKFSKLTRKEKRVISRLRPLVLLYTVNGLLQFYKFIFF